MNKNLQILMISESDMKEAGYSETEIQIAKDQVVAFNDKASKDKNSTLVLKKGKLIKQSGFTKFINRTGVGVFGASAVVVLTIAVAVEFFGLFRLNNRTPGTHVRKAFSSDKP